MKLVNLGSRVALVAVLVLGALGCASSSSVAPPTSSSMTSSAMPVAPVGPLGVFSGTERPDLVDDFERWLGHRVGYALDYLGAAAAGADPWAGIDDPSQRCAAWARDRRHLVLSVAILPSGRQRLGAGAKGDYDAHWDKFGAGMVSAGCADATLRLGWEFNGLFYPWAAGGQEAAYAAYWRRIVERLRAVPGSSFAFDWSVLAGNANADVEAAYPGDDVVDIISLDAYDTSQLRTPDDRWEDQLDRPYGLRWHEQFAARHRKRLAFSEWGVVVRPNDSLGGGDAPAYIEHMIDWIRSHDVAYAIYFDVDARDAAHRLSKGRFPQAAAAFRRRAVELAGSAV